MNPGDDRKGFLKTRVKKHRWYTNILKTNDPLIFSIGWRRFQSIPIFVKQDQNDRLRRLKYTPEYDFCEAIFYAHFAPQNTGIICFQSIDNELMKFRVAATGFVIEINHAFPIMKKLKLIGAPFRIFKKTAFIKDMFNSDVRPSQF